MSLSRLGCLILSACACSATATAGSLAFSFTGAFTQDDQLELFQFTAPSASVLVRTWSYAGGTNAAGSPISAGGFDPILSIFDATGGLTASSTLITQNDNGPLCPLGSPACVNIDPASGAAFDSLLTLTGLNAGGTYAVVLSQGGNPANGPNYGAGFLQAGAGNFTASLYPCGGTSFCDSNLAQRNGQWAVDIVGVGTAADVTGGGVPEPGSLFLLGSGLAAAGLLRRKRITNRV